MGAVTIRPAREADLPALDHALAGLSAALGDAHRADRARLAHALFGPQPATWAVVAATPGGGADGGGALAGAALYTPLFSTVRGMAGLYVSDLWVAEGRRGARLGRRLLAGALADARGRWGAGYLKLTVYAGNPRARAFYDRLGFREAPGEHVLTLEGAALAALEETS
jgi:ribosomal protein S18 acetylase RimI-like enzyme